MYPLHQAVFNASEKPQGKDRRGNHRDAEYYMSHYQKDANTEKG